VNFNSFAFVIFFVVVFGLYHALGRRLRAQNRLLLVASYVFYASWDWRFLSLILLSTAVDYACSLSMRARPERAGAALGVSLTANLGLLFTFKYFHFFEESAVALLEALGIPAHPTTLRIVLPVGISFYTFQTLSYTIDVYRGRLEPTRDLLDFALYVAFFPQLVAGPIERATHFLPQIQSPRRVTTDQLTEGSWLVMWGYFKKVYVADNVARLVDVGFSPDFDGSGGSLLVATWAFAIQIYCDFSGYTDIARGVAKLLGFELMLNFDLPYFARNPSDFWRRWHISLSTWLRDYLYIPLGGNRGGTVRTYRNLFLTMLLGGLWHGAAWTFVFWGAFHGLWLGVHRALAPRLPRLPPRLAGAGSVLAVLGTFHAVCVGWVFFRASSLEQALSILGRIASGPGFDHHAWESLGWLLTWSGLLIAAQGVQLWRGDLYLVRGVGPFARGLVYGTLFYLVALHGAVSDAFIYFQF
jgi:D-alanyl-lipoteichoic acid acyltransferase DltB (MBOAT superfamily)